MRSPLLCLRPPAAAAALLMLALAAASGCARTHRGLCEEQLRARCELAYRCCTDPNERFALLPADLTAYATSEGECFDRLAPLCRGQDVLDDAVDLGRMQLDQELAALCVETLVAARDACDAAAFDGAFVVDTVPPLDDDAAPCVTASQGRVDNGGSCGATSECATGGFCDLVSSAPPFDDDVAAFEGTCVSPALAGEPCSAFGCAAGLFCVDETCIVPPDDGEPCPDFVCAEGNVCNADGECEAFPEIGDRCEFQCVAGAFCDPSDNKGESGTCAPQREPGASCEGVFSECANGEQCLNGACTGVVEAVCTGP